MTRLSPLPGRSLRGWSRVAVLALVLGLAALVVPDSAVKPTEVSLVRIRHGSGLDAQREMVWILAVGSDARPGEDMNRTRGDALPAGRHQHPDPRGHGDRDPA